MNATIHYSPDKGWPSEEQDLLLRALLLEGKEAFDAWRRWQARVDIDALDQGSERLLPLLYHNLREQGVDVNTSVMWKLKGFYRLNWVRNQLLFRTMTTLLRQLHGAGFRTMILKGTALTVLYYKDYGLRPMADFDILIPTQQAHEAVKFLPRIGWKPVPRSPEKFTEHYIPIVHAHEFRNAKDQPFDLHWHVLEECCQADADDDFWEGAILVTVQDVPTFALNPTDQLLHACVHGFRWNPVPPMRWITDAMMILKHPETRIDWDRLINQGQQRRLILPVRDALRYLHTSFSVPIPQEVLQWLQQSPVAKLEQLEYRYKRQNFHQKPFGYLPVMWFNCERWIGDVSLPRKLWGFGDYIRRFWGVEHFGEFLLYVMRMFFRRIREFITPN